MRQSHARILDCYLKVCVSEAYLITHKRLMNLALGGKIGI